jgi:release factor glutamine methyltransferase
MGADSRFGATRDRLAAAGCVAAAEEAEAMLAADPDGPTLDAWLRRREDGEPLEWIVGATDFCGRSLIVAPGVYVPRRQTEELARRAAECLPPGGRALDLCTGAGAIAAHLVGVVPSATVVGIDLDVHAAACARRNGVRAIVGDLASAITASPPFDVVTAVAPYVPTDHLRLLPPDVQRHEPRLALDGGDDGLGLVRRVVRDAGRLLRRGGTMLVEVGGEQDVLLEPTLRDAGFDAIESWHDDEGDLRGLMARHR